jgi:phage repressor protein C with HTH and peptisase S24 domain
MSTDYIEELKQGLTRPGKTQRGLAAMLGLDPAAVNRMLKGKRHLKADELARAREYLDLPEPAPPPPMRTPGGYALSHVPAWTRDVPILGIGACGEDGVFELNGQTVGYSRRPPRLLGSRDVYALYITGQSMEPWREEGELVYVHQHQPATINDYVVVQLHPKAEGEPPAAYIKRLVKRTPGELRLLQYNPRKEIVVPMKKVLSVHRIIDWSELLGD